MPGKAPTVTDALVGLGRGFGGAVVFSLPLLMTEEVWRIGAGLEPWRLALLVGASIPLFVRLSYHTGFEETFSWREDVRDALIAYAIGWIAAAGGLLLVGAIDSRTPASAAAGMIALQAVPATFGALLARTQLAHEAVRAKGSGPPAAYLGELFVMLAGALLLALNIAPTVEVVQIAHRLGAWHQIALVLASLALMHAFVYGVAFRGQHGPAQGAAGTARLLLRFTVVGYMLALATSLFVLWLIGRVTDTGFAHALGQTLVLGLPAAVGAAAARLIL